MQQFVETAFIERDLDYIISINNHILSSALPAQSGAHFWSLYITKHKEKSRKENSHDETCMTNGNIFFPFVNLVCKMSFKNKQVTTANCPQHFFCHITSSKI